MQCGYCYYDETLSTLYASYPLNYPSGLLGLPAKAGKFVKNEYDTRCSSR